jgi:hypothetical protein
MAYCGNLCCVGSVSLNTERMYAYGPAAIDATFINAPNQWSFFVCMFIAHVCCTWMTSYTCCILYNHVIRHIRGLIEIMRTEVDGLLLVGKDPCDSDSESDSEEDEPVDLPTHPVMHSEVVGTFVRDSMMSTMTNHIDHISTRSVSLERAMKLKLRCPGPDAICPISMDSISTSQVNGFEGFLLDAKHPTFTEAILECGHSFSASYLVVSWLTSHMRCPLCRAGIDAHLDINCIPMKWKDAADAHVGRLRMDDGEQHTNEVLAMQTVFSLQLHMCVYLTLHDGSVHGMVVNFINDPPPNHVEQGDDLRLRVPRAQIRSLSRVAVGQNASSMNCVVFVRRIDEDSNVHLQEVAQSGPLHVPVAESYRSSMFSAHNGTPHRDVVIVHQSDIRRPEDVTGQNTNRHATFGIGWQVYTTRVLNTITDVKFEVKFSDLAVFIGDMFE